jgi:hypothetical protein
MVMISAGRFALVCLILLAFPVFGPVVRMAPSRPLIPGSEAEAAESLPSRQLPEHVEAVCLLEVVDGRPRETVWPRKDLMAGRELAVRGYVAGVTVVSRCPDLVASVVPPGGQPREMASRVLVADGRVTGGGQRYAYFPRIRGDAVSPGERFGLSIEDADGAWELAIRQRGYQALTPPGAEDPAAGRGPGFRYIGSDLEEFRRRGDDLARRVREMAEGIARVEQAFGGDLVRYVNVLDYQGPDNALTVTGQAEIWLYAGTLWNQPPGELGSMAEHETLHLVVDRQGYTGRSAVRELFADLHGFGPLSMERFALVAGGRLPPRTAPPPGGTAVFLPFIDERNFLVGRSGGHARENIDEFCTSFLHTLLYVDRLEANLRQPHLRLEDGTTLDLTADHRTTLVRDYRRSLEVLAEAAGPSTPEAPAAAFFRRCASAAALAAPVCDIEPAGVGVRR